MCIPVTGNPPKPHCSFKSLASPTVVSGERTIGSEMKPFSNLLTFLTISACSSAEQLWWIMPSPPRRAIYMAILSSVTVSMGEDRSGVLREILFVIGESRVTEEAAKPAESS